MLFLMLLPDQLFRYVSVTALLESCDTLIACRSVGNLSVLELI